MMAGLGYVADDCALVDVAAYPRAHALYGSAQIGPASLRILPELASLVSRPATAEPPRLTLDVWRTRPELMRRSAAITAILVPRVTGGPLAVRSISRADALRSLAPATILQQADESANGMAVMAMLVRRVPAFSLELGSDVAAVAPAISELLEDPA
jgi:hypothetical protein